MRCAILGVCLLLAGCSSLGGNGSPQARGVRFVSFYAGLEQEIKAQGLDVHVLRASYGGAKPAPLPDARKAEKTQAEFTGALDGYVNRAVTAARVAKGKALLAEHKQILQKIEAQYGVPAELIVALWGMESDYGRHQGTMPLLPTLVSMAYKSPRYDMFERELFVALKLKGIENVKGSWAGASGHCQFMPSNIVKHGRDGNGDGRVDIWNTPSDAFASTANFVRALGYVQGQPWHWDVKKAPDLEGISLNERGLSEPLIATQWQARSVNIKGVSGQTKLRFYKPREGEIMMVGPNYEALLGWNYSSFFATSVWMLAERIGKK